MQQPESTNLIPANHYVWDDILQELLGEERMTNIVEIYSRLNINYIPDSGKECPINQLELMKELFKDRKCGRSGCCSVYREINNNKEACTYHSGTLRAGIKLSCCRAKNFRAPGCKHGFHNGTFFNVLYSARPEDSNTNENNNKPSRRQNEDKKKDRLTLPPIFQDNNIEQEKINMFSPK